MAKNEIKEGGFKKRRAQEVAKVVCQAGLWPKVWVSSCFVTMGYEVNYSCADGSYQKTMRYEDSFEDFKQIFADQLV